VSDFQGALLAAAREKAAEHDAQASALLGFTDAALVVLAALREAGLGERIVGVFDPSHDGPSAQPLRAWTDLADLEPDLLVICVDSRKEALLRAYRDLARTNAPLPEVALAGVAHLEFRDPVYSELDAPALVPSYATGHPLTRVHLYQCLKAAAAAELSGAIVELGAFKGGTTAWLARTAGRLGLNARIIAFDSWGGFPPRRSLLDLYEHPRCVFTDLEAVRSQLEPLGVELVAGDIAVTAPERLEDEPVLLGFVDTDNYSGTKAALEVMVRTLVPGGAVVFDHYWTTEKYVYTLGERLAAQEVLGDSGLLQLQGTGVFVKLR
jgi:O-methyltransferase